jgi:helicase
VPFRSLANEVYDHFHDLLGSTNYRLPISTGDYREPIRPEESDLIVATYESFAALVRRTGLAPGTVIADEIHLVEDDHRGPVVEGLLSRLLASGRIASLCGLSAVVENGKELADWLGIEFLEGTPEDRPVVLELLDRLVKDLDKGLKGELRSCFNGGQGLVFCSSRRGAEKTARFLSDEMKLKIPTETRQELYKLSAAVLEEDPEAEGLAELLPTGVALHHAGLVKSLRCGNGPGGCASG